MNFVCKTKTEAVQALETLAEAMPRGAQRDAIEAVKEWAAGIDDRKDKITVTFPEPKQDYVEYHVAKYMAAHCPVCDHRLEVLN